MDRRDKIARRLRAAVKRSRQYLSRGDDQQLLFVVGCQRSGTAMLLRIFEADPTAGVYREVSPISSTEDPKRLRLRPLPDVAAHLGRDPASLLVTKPLVESQRILELLDFFPGSKAVWMYRNYRSVARSYLRKWGPSQSRDDLLAIVHDEPDNWRNEGVSEETREVVRKHFRQGMDPLAATALYWYVRNRFVPQLGLADDPRIRLVRYETLVDDPLSEIEAIYRLLDRQGPIDAQARLVHTSAKSRGRDVELDPAVDLLCRELLEELDRLVAQQAALKAGG